MMISQSLKYFLLLFLSLSFNVLYSQVPDGAIRLNAETGTTYQKLGQCTVTEVSIEDQVFTRAIRVQTGANMSNAWDAQLRFPAVAGIEKNDVVLVAFYARTIESVEETGEGFVMATIEENVTYAKELYYKLSIGNEWKEYYAPVEIRNTLAASQLSYLFHMGYENQTVEVADVRFLNYKNTLTMDDLPLTEITYVGQAPDASWRAPAEERIGQIRKGPAEITVYNELGEPMKDAEVHIEMVKHQFGFGTAVVSGRINTSKVYRDTLFDIFNEVVFENDLKWPQFEYEYTRNNISRSLDTLDAHQVPARGHNIIWPSFNYMPDFCEDLAGAPERLCQEIDDHFDEVTAFTRGRLNDWDVMNEPYTEHEVQDILGDGVMADWYKRTRRNDRGVKLYINDYYILSGGGNNTKKQDYYYNLIQEIDTQGGEIDGIGMQGHFSTELTSITKVYNILDRFAELDKEIKITEHDIDITQRGVQADYTRDFMTIVFSHPSVKSLLVWGFWAGAHWKPEAAFFDQDWNIRPHGEAWRDMIKNVWWTPAFDKVSDENGQLYFEGYLGTYSYTVRDGDHVRTGTFTLDHSNQSSITNAIQISMDESIPEGVQIIPDQEGFICEGEEMILHAPEGEGLSYAWTLGGIALPDESASIITGDSGLYQVTVSKSGISRTSEPYLLEVRAIPEAEIIVEGELTFCPEGSVTMTVNSGTNMDYEWFENGDRVQWGGTSYEADMSGVFSVIVISEGCYAESEPVVATRLSTTDPQCATGIELNQSGNRIFPNPCHGSVQVELVSGSAVDASLELYDAMGRLRYSEQTRSGTSLITIPVPDPGLYMIRIKEGETIQTHKLVAE